MSFPQLKAKIIVNPSEAKAMWNDLGEEFIAGASQSAAWFTAWQSFANPDCLIAALCDGEKPALLLPLEIERKGPVRIAIYAGGPHANCNFPAISPACKVTDGDLSALVKALAQARPDIDLIALARQLSQLGGKDNPLLQLTSRENANISLGVTLDRDFEAVLRRVNAKRKKKKHRNSANHFDEAGGYRIVTATSPAETDAMLQNYFECKAERLARAGIKNTYEPAGIAAFFRKIFTDEAGLPSPRYQLKALEVGGKYRAVMGKSFAGGQTFIDFIGITEDELVSASPGEFLFYEDIQASCEAGLSVYSFGIGDEPYKRSWSDIELPTYDTDIALTAKGRMFEAYLRSRRGLVRSIKQNDVLWAKVKKLRATLRGTR